MCVCEGVCVCVCVLRGYSLSSCSLLLNPIRELIGRRRVSGSGLLPRWLMGFPDREP